MSSSHKKNLKLKLLFFISIFVLGGLLLIFFLVKDSVDDQSLKPQTKLQEKSLDFDEEPKLQKQAKVFKEKKQKKKPKSKEARIYDILEGTWQSCHKFAALRFDFSRTDLKVTKLHYENYDCTGKALLEERSDFSYKFSLPSKASQNFLPIDYTLEEAYYILLSDKTKEREDIHQKFGLSYEEFLNAPLQTRLDYPLNKFTHLRKGTTFYDLIAPGSLYLTLGEKCVKESSGKKICTVPDSPSKRPSKVRRRLYKEENQSPF